MSLFGWFCIVLRRKGTIFFPHHQIILPKLFAKCIRKRGNGGQRGEVGMSGAATSTSPGYSAAARARKTARRRALTCTASLSINNMLRPEGQRFYFTSSLVVLAPRRTMYTWPAWGSATRMPCRLKYSAASLPSTVTSSMPVVGMSVSVLL